MRFLKIAFLTSLTLYCSEGFCEREGSGAGLPAAAQISLTDFSEERSIAMLDVLLDVLKNATTDNTLVKFTNRSDKIKKRQIVCIEFARALVLTGFIHEIRDAIRSNAEANAQLQTMVKCP